MYFLCGPIVEKIIIGHFCMWLPMWQGNQNRGHRQSSLRNAQNVSYHTSCLMSSGAKKQIRDNTICQCTVVQIYRVTPESCDNIGLFSLSPRLVHLPDRRYIRDCCPYWNPLVTLMTRGFAGVRACCFDN